LEGVGEVKKTKSEIRKTKKFNHREHRVKSNTKNTKKLSFGLKNSPPLEGLGEVKKYFVSRQKLNNKQQTLN